MFDQTNFSCLKIRLPQWAMAREWNLQVVACAMLRLLVRGIKEPQQVTGSLCWCQAQSECFIFRGLWLNEAHPSHPLIPVPNSAGFSGVRREVKCISATIDWTLNVVLTKWIPVLLSGPIYLLYLLFLLAHARSAVLTQRGWVFF